jgi:uncharacterized OB-fold protein
MFTRMFKFVGTPERGDEILLSKCKDCGAYFFDAAGFGSCCEEEKPLPGERMQSNIMQFLIDRRR